jgi:hypothetical protein
MMNVPPSEAKALSLWEYEAILHHHNEAHGGGDVEPPVPEVAMAILERANSDPRLVN